MLTDAGLADVHVGVGARKSGDPFTVLIASARKPAAKTAGAGVKTASKPANDPKTRRRESQEEETR